MGGALLFRKGRGCGRGLVLGKQGMALYLPILFFYAVILYQMSDENAVRVVSIGATAVGQ